MEIASPPEITITFQFIRATREDAGTFDSFTMDRRTIFSKDFTASSVLSILLLTEHRLFKFPSVLKRNPEISPGLYYPLYPLLFYK